MKPKRLIITLIIFVIIATIFFFCTRGKQEDKDISGEEIVPEEEISEEQQRKTMVALYFANSTDGELEKEVRTIDAKILAQNPYRELVQMLINGPNNSKLKSVIPVGTKINNVNIIGNTVYLDLSKEFIENHEGGIENESKTIYSVVNTLTELNEVSFIRILIDGQENMGFKDRMHEF